MGDLSVTAASVLPYGGFTSEYGTAGEAITAGQPVYRSSTDNLIYVADAQTNPAGAKAAVLGIALTGASASQPVKIQTGGDINPGATVAIGQVYCLSATAGGIALESDLVSTDYVTILGVGQTATKMHLILYATGVAHA